MLQELVMRLQQQGEINEALKEALSHTGGGSSGLQLKLPHFYGKAGENVTTWIFQCESVFNAKKIEDNIQRLNYMPGCLHEAALHWYQNTCMMATVHEDPFDNDWNIFVASIKKAFQPPHYQQILRRQLKTLKQTGQVQDYVYKFRNLVSQIEEMGQLDQVMHFVEGLKSATRVKVNYCTPDTLTDVIEVAIAYDTARFGPGRALSSSNHHQQSYSHSNYR